MEFERLLGLHGRRKFNTDHSSARCEAAPRRDNNPSIQNISERGHDMGIEGYSIWFSWHVDLPHARRCPRHCLVPLFTRQLEYACRSHRCRDRVRFAPLRHGRTGGRHRFSCNHGVRRVSRGGDAGDSTYAEYRGSRLCDLAAASAGSRSYGGSSWIHLRSDRCWRGSGCGRSSVIVKIKRNAATMLLNAGAFVPSSDRCNWNRRMSSAAAVSGDRDRNAAKRERI